jgi:hypothetical protein
VESVMDVRSSWSWRSWGAPDRTVDRAAAWRLPRSLGATPRSGWTRQRTFGHLQRHRSRSWRRGRARHPDHRRRLPFARTADGDRSRVSVCAEGLGNTAARSWAATVAWWSSTREHVKWARSGCASRARTIHRRQCSRDRRRREARLHIRHQAERTVARSPPVRAACSRSGLRRQASLDPLSAHGQSPPRNRCAG